MSGMSRKVTDPGAVIQWLCSLAGSERLSARGRGPLVSLGSSEPLRPSGGAYGGFSRSAGLCCRQEGAAAAIVKLNLPVFDVVFLGVEGRRSRNFGRLGEL